MSVPLPSPPPPEPGLAELVRAHQASVWRYLRFLGADPISADDLTQETFIAAWGKPLQRFGSDGAGAYLRRTARNLWLKAVGQRRVATLEPEVAEAAYEWFRRDDDGAEMLAALRVCLDSVPAPARRALELRFAQLSDRAAIAADLALSEEGVKSLLQRTYARLRACIERRLRDA